MDAGYASYETRNQSGVQVVYRSHGSIYEIASREWMVVWWARELLFLLFAVDWRQLRA